MMDKKIFCETHLNLEEKALKVKEGICRCPGLCTCNVVDLFRYNRCLNCGDLIFLSGNQEKFNEFYRFTFPLEPLKTIN